MKRSVSADHEPPTAFHGIIRKRLGRGHRRPPKTCQLRSSENSSLVGHESGSADIARYQSAGYSGDERCNMDAAFPRHAKQHLLFVRNEKLITDSLSTLAREGACFDNAMESAVESGACLPEKRSRGQLIVAACCGECCVAPPLLAWVSC